MAKRLGSAALIVVLSLGATALPRSDASASQGPAALIATNPVAVYGSEILFDVYRNGDKVGAHSVRFDEQGSDLTVESRFEIEIDVLFFTAYRYLYESEGRWRDGRLEGLDVRIDDDGDRSAVAVERRGEGFRVENSRESFEAQGPIYPTNHWNSAVLDQTRVLNTITGRINEVRIEPRERDMVPTELGVVPATRYAYTGQLRTEVWYDDSGRWVKMRFAGSDGSTIEYLCRLCQGGNPSTAQR